MRLAYGNLPQQTISTPKYWIYQYRNSVEQEWNSFYAFNEMEFFLADFVGMNHFTSTFTEYPNLQTTTVLVVRFLKGVGEGVGGEGKEEEIVGKLMLVNGVVKRNDGGKTSVVKVCVNEEERLKAIKEDFEMILVEDEINAIAGWHTELVEKWWNSYKNLDEER